MTTLRTSTAFRRTHGSGAALVLSVLLGLSGHALAQDVGPEMSVDDEPPPSGPDAPPEPEPLPEVSPNDDRSEATQSGDDFEYQYEEPATVEEESESPWYADKDDLPYFDFFFGYGAWQSDAIFTTVSPLSFLWHRDRKVLAGHLRLLSLGYLGFTQRVEKADGTTVNEAEHTFLLTLLEVGPRIYMGPLYFKVEPGFGMSFYDGLVPMIDVQVGLGFEYKGWGLEGGIRSILQPNGVIISNGDPYVKSDYGLMVYGALETNLQWGD